MFQKSFGRGSFRRALSSAAVLTLTASGQSRPPTNSATCMQSTAVSSLPSAARPRKGRLAVPKNVPNLSAPVGLLSAAVVLFAAIGFVIGAQDGGGPEVWFTITPVLKTAPTSMALFFAADAVAQKLGGDGKSDFDLKRALSCSLLGLGLNSMGFQFWLHYIDSVFPPDSVGMGSARDACGLLAKSLLDSFVWGSISNSLGIFLRQTMAGSSAQQAFSVWESKFLYVMVQDAKFWTLWMSLCYSVIPAHLRVQWVALGALFFNIYLSSVSSEASNRK